MFKKLLGNISIQQLATEFVSVVVAVLMALGVNEWRESRANEELAEAAFAGIVAELTENRHRLSETLVDHDSLLVTLEAQFEKIRDKRDLEVHPDDVSFTFDYSLGVLSSTAWRTAMVTQAARYMDMSLVRDLSDLYDLQQVYSDHDREIVSALGSLAFYQQSNARPRLMSSIANLKISISLLKALVSGIDSFLAEHEKKFIAADSTTIG